MVVRGKDLVRDSVVDLKEESERIGDSRGVGRGIL